VVVLTCIDLQLSLAINTTSRWRRLQLIV